VLIRTSPLAGEVIRIRSIIELPGVNVPEIVPGERDCHAVAAVGVMELKFMPLTIVPAVSIACIVIVPVVVFEVYVSIVIGVVFAQALKSLGIGTCTTTS
jgi:hypothetical protein